MQLFAFLSRLGRSAYGNLHFPCRASAVVSVSLLMVYYVALKTGDVLLESQWIQALLGTNDAPTWETVLSLVLLCLLTSRIIELQYGSWVSIGNAAISVGVCGVASYILGPGAGVSVPTMLITSNIMLLICTDDARGRIPIDGILIAFIYLWWAWQLHTFISVLLGATCGGLYIAYKWREFSFCWRTGFCVTGWVTLIFSLLCLVFMFWGFKDVEVVKKLADDSVVTTNEQELTLVAKLWFRSVPYDFFDIDELRDWCATVLHVFGHGDNNHFTGNIVMILIIGRRIEAHYQPWVLPVGMLLTAIVTGLVATLTSQVIIGASGIACMMYAMLSFADNSNSKYPVGGILLIVVYMAREYQDWQESSQVAHDAHLLGFFVGAIIGVAFSNKRTAEALTN